MNVASALHVRDVSQLVEDNLNLRAHIQSLLHEADDLYEQSLALYDAVIDQAARDDVDIRLSAAYASRSVLQDATVHISGSNTTLSVTDHEASWHLPSPHRAQLFRSPGNSPGQLQPSVPRSFPAAGHGRVPASSPPHDSSDPCRLAGGGGAGDCVPRCCAGRCRCHFHAGEAGCGGVAADHSLQGVSQGGEEEESCFSWHDRGGGGVWW
jgi:hypothetical protein